jgi:MFS family permease
MTTEPTGAAASIRRRTRVYWACHFMRWLPLGLMMPVMALLPAQRGLSLADIGLIFGLYAATAAALELPTGNLADIVGRKPLLMAAALFEIGWYAGFLLAGSVTGFAVAIILGGAGRALASGALEAWYVDEVYAERPGTDVRPAISGAMFLTNAAVLIGALAAAGLPLLPAKAISWADSVAMLPVVTALLGMLAYLVMLPILVQESRPHRGAPRALLRELRSAPALVRTSLRLSVQAGALRLLLLAGVAIGIGIGAVEAFWQPELAEMLGDPAEATTAFGLIVGASTVIGGCASLIAARLPARLARRGDLACAALLVLVAAAMVLLAVAGNFAVAVAGFLAMHFFVELRAPLAQTLLHAAAPAGQRASVLSTYSMSTNLGAVIATVGLGSLVNLWSVQIVWIVSAVVTLFGAIAYLRLRRVAVEQADPAEPAPADVLGTPAIPV